MTVERVRVCLLTPGQPSTNPRLVKEADVLTEAGYDVHVLCGYWTDWAFEADGVLLASRSWSWTYVGGNPRRHRIRYAWSRICHGLSRRCLAAWGASSVVRERALCRVLPELRRAAKSTPADLYIAHGLGALPAAGSAGEEHGACVGFDAEDFHSAERAQRPDLSALAEAIERMHLPRCDYITASSPSIAEAYAAKYGIPKPVTILNVFPLSQRPKTFRASTPGGPLTLYWFSQTIGAHRGLEDVIRAMGDLRDCGIELHLRGVWQPGYRDHLFRLAAAVGLDPRQIVAHWPERPGEMVRLASVFDVGLALEPGRDGNNRIALSNKIFTYLLAGNAVVATATEGQRPVVETIGGAGFCYEPGDVKALAGRLRAWYEDRASLERARREAWEWGSREYNWDLEKKKYLQVIGRVLAARRGRMAAECDVTQDSPTGVRWRD